jgi:hypothetical protein
VTLSSPTSTVAQPTKHIKAGSTIKINLISFRSNHIYPWPPFCSESSCKSAYLLEVECHTSNSSKSCAFLRRPLSISKGENFWDERSSSAYITTDTKSRTTPQSQTERIAPDNVDSTTFRECQGVVESSEDRASVWGMIGSIAA